MCVEGEISEIHPRHARKKIFCNKKKLVIYIQTCENVEGIVVKNKKKITENNLAKV